MRGRRSYLKEYGGIGNAIQFSMVQTKATAERQEFFAIFAPSR